MGGGVRDDSSERKQKEGRAWEQHVLRHRRRSTVINTEDPDRDAEGRPVQIEIPATEQRVAGE
jgi:hypothetical protein